ncbi:ABC transporter ATP-binding protein [Sutcliffiella rhizosphaerae]|uniref:High-affinity branched-chain amino acid transport ATP-binding protein LivF n=1 Tax=Sutcliffiella rhizosphaerae TaxID=2880967 RepID=A0ABM8YLT1_9BACI|nr:ABC transporter ATP-binding protein [Sutcliffiella rhizosphaerae]CAG9620926.1 High-affinity branched-chain amino acid transport ATP-binding protein LivF [Sutcliffiella rhizosphaerae]
MLKIDNINVYYGNIHALKGVSLEINEGEIVTLIGANGAGKSTLLKTISGLLKPKDGEILFQDQSIGGKVAQTIVKQGISHVPEGRRVFANMSVEENLELGAYLRKDKKGIKEDFEKVYDLFPRLFERRKQLSGTLSGGEQQMLAMGRALMARPKVLLLDEPSMGLAPLLVKTIFRIIEEINQSESGTTILLIEQNANMALSIADRAYVIETGKIVLAGTPDELNESDQVRLAYLGGY